MNDECREVLKKCNENTFWLGIEINDVNQRNFAGNTPLHTIVRDQDIDKVKILLENGADINAIGEFGMTPLFFAVSANSLKVVEYLLKNGADPLIKNEWGFTARGYSKRASQEVLDILDKKIGTYVPPAKPKKKKEKGDKYTKQGKRR